MSSTRDKILSKVRKVKNGKTKRELANNLGLSYNQVSAVVNDLVAKGLLVPRKKNYTGKRGRPTTVYGAK